MAHTRNDQLQAVVEQNQRMIMLLEEIRDSIKVALTLPSFRPTTIDLTTYNHDPRQQARKIADAISTIVLEPNPDRTDRHAASRRFQTDPDRQGITR